MLVDLAGIAHRRSGEYHTIRRAGRIISFVGTLISGLKGRNSKAQGNAA
jgi:hypothetical protein